MTDFQHQLQQLQANRRSPEARAFYLGLLRYVERRVQGLTRQRYSDLLSPTDLEEVVADVGMRLMTGALSRFRGSTPAELYAYVRTISDRGLGRVVRKRLRERDILEDYGVEQATDMLGSMPSPDIQAEVEASCPLNQRDQDYLLRLMAAGSKAEYARRNNQSRAAVTRMVQRIRTRIDALEPQQRTAVDVWMHQQARELLEAQAAGPPA
jgi:hypothetical protein